ncbi:MAG: cbb3-type cytochrome c oxidase N-terminal domain-containing protein [Nannocystaceae bacterium]
MAKVTDQSFDHDYDGIKEYDNPLPGWWVWMFILCVAWAVVYIPYYHFGPGQLPVEFYDEDMAAWLAAHPPEPLPDEAQMIAMADDPTLLATGQSVFVSRCVTCHGPDGGGQVGPNLADEYTIHGYSRATIVRVIHDGVQEKGMLAWKNQLSREEIYGAALYVYGLRGTTPTNPKEPQGDPIVDEAEATPAAGQGEGDAAGQGDAAGAGDVAPAGNDVAPSPTETAPDAAQ